MTVRAYVGVGSSIDPERNTCAALRALDREHRVRIVAVSTFYRTAPIGHPHDPSFVNGVVAVETELPAMELKWRVLRRIEAELGRRRGADPDAPRTIDLDLLLYDGETCRSARLVLPDPQIAARAFLAWPLVELDPALVLPGGPPVRALAEQLSRADLAALPELTARLREEVPPA